MIDIATLKEYIKVLEDSTLQAMELSDGTDTIHLEKAYNDVATTQTVNVTPQVVAGADGPTAVVNLPKAPEAAGKTINAPIVGVFYAAPSPTAEPYVTVGKRVKKGDTVCIIEAMKCMNEIQAEEDGVITDILVNNEQLVEFDQPLFAIQ